MKKILTIIAIMGTILIYSVNVMAVGIEEINMNIEIPEEYYDLKSGIESNDSKIEYYEAILNVTKEDLISQYEQNSILYNGINTNLSKEIIISRVESNITKNIFHLNTATADKINEIKSLLIENAQLQNMEVESQEEYICNNLLFINTIIHSEDRTIFQYYTIVNGSAITISLNSSYTNTSNNELKEIIDTISFEEILEKPTDYTNYIIYGISVILIIMVIAIMILAFSGKKNKF